jgi:hypothetical protein
MGSESQRCRGPDTAIPVAYMLRAGSRVIVYGRPWMLPPLVHPEYSMALRSVQQVNCPNHVRQQHSGSDVT